MRGGLWGIIVPEILFDIRVGGERHHQGNRA